MKDQFVTYHLAFKLKELGFKEACFGIFFNSDPMGWQFGFTPFQPQGPDICSAPLWQQAIDFLHTIGIHCPYESDKEFMENTMWAYINGDIDKLINS
jgi:hypothetical protein